MSDAEVLVDLAFAGEVIQWRGPAPFFFVAVPDDRVGEIRDAAQRASYGWGCVPVSAAANGTAFTSALFPKDGGYLLPLKAEVRKRTAVSLGDTVAIEMQVRAR